MCGRFFLDKIDELEDRFELEVSDDTLDKLIENFNISPGQNIPVVTRHSPNRLVLMRWGLIPSWSKDAKTGYKMINARVEGIESKPSFRKPLRSQRCLIPASGYYEWKREGKTNTPYSFKPTNSVLIAMAGLYDIWQSPNGQSIHSCAIITTAANNQTKPIHDRMPVILEKDNESAWLDPDITETSEILSILKPRKVELDISIAENLV